MKQVNCPICNCKCIKHGKIKSGSQRWFCKSCKLAFTPKIDNDTKQLQLFLNWLF
ncbi:MAG: IS256 family transposase, partial [[Eubacterium] sulci]|nr:IS256 family transposase [[Eubacterium] sulci]